MKKIVFYRGKKAVFDGRNIQLSEWYDDITLISKNFCILTKDNKMSLANTKDFKPIKWHPRIFPEGILQKKSSYYLAQEENSLLAIYSIFREKVSSEWSSISASGLVSGESNAYIVSDSAGDKSIFNKDGIQISEWFKDISEEGLVKGHSEYYIGTKTNDDGTEVQAIFHKSGKQVSPWAKHVYSYGVVEGKSEYFILRSEDLTAKLMHLSGEVVIEGVVDIRPDGIVRSPKSSFITVFDGEKDIVYRIEDNKIAEKMLGAEAIWPDGLVNGDSEYCIASNGAYESLYFRGQEIVKRKKAILARGLLKRETEYFAAKETNGSWSVYDRHGNMLVFGLEYVFDSGLLKDKSSYIAAIKDGEIYIFHKDLPEINLRPHAEARYGIIETAKKAKSLVDNKASVSYLTRYVSADKSTYSKLKSIETFANVTSKTSKPRIKQRCLLR